MKNASNIETGKKTLAASASPPSPAAQWPTRRKRYYGQLADDNLTT